MNENLRAVVLHLSDLHFFADFQKSKRKKILDKVKNALRKKAFALIKEQFSDLNPHDGIIREDLATCISKFSRQNQNNKQIDYLIVSGDLTTLGDEESFADVKDFLTKPWEFVNPGLGFSMNDITVVPGNHDTILNKYFGNGENRLRNYYKVFSEKLPFSKFVDINGKKFTFFAFDSTSDGLLHFSDGEITKENILWMRKRDHYLEREIGDDYKNGIKVVVFHHHPIPLPGTRSSVWTQLIDGSEFLPVLQEVGIDLILHGHEHLTATSRVEYLYSYGKKTNGKPLTICSAGTATQETVKKLNSFNLFYFYDKTVFLEIWEYDNRRLFFYPKKDRIRLF